MRSMFELAESDDNVILLTADLGFGVFEEFSEKFPQQFLNVGVSEQNTIGIASGLALEGRTIFIYSIGNFPTLRCLEHIRNDACYHNLNINIVASGGGFSYGALGMSHHATEDIAIIRALPGTSVLVPGTQEESRCATKLLGSTEGVGYLRLDKSTAQEMPDRVVKIGNAQRYREGDAVTLLCAGGILQEALDAADSLAKENIKCRVLSVFSVKPIDKNEIILACEETGGVITLEEHNVYGGLAGAVSEACMLSNIWPKKFLSMSLNDSYSSIVGSQGYLREYYKLDKNAIITNVKDLL